jgi:protein phosphatase
LPAQPLLSVWCHGRTDRGRCRRFNEDQFLIATLNRAVRVQSSLPQESTHHGLPQGHLFVVADGLGGSNAGEFASALAVGTLEAFALHAMTSGPSLCGSGGEGVLAEFKKAVERANERVYRESQRRPELRGMATTLTLAYLLGKDLYVAHVGDSRCYLLRSQQLCRLTCDHTLVAEMVQQGLLKPEEATRHDTRHVITNVVGGCDPEVHVELHHVPVEAGDRLLLCTDGLTEMVPDVEILGLLQRAADPSAACHRLIDRANEQGGRDNVTVVVAFFGEAQPASTLRPA